MHRENIDVSRHANHKINIPRPNTDIQQGWDVSKAASYLIQHTPKTKIQ